MVCAPKVLDERRDVVLDDVVAENHADRSSFGEVFAELERVGDAALTFLIGVVDVFEAEVAAVSQQAQKIAGGVPPVTIMMSLMPALHSVSSG